MNNQEAIDSLKNIVEYWTCRPTEVEAAKLAISALEQQLHNGWIPVTWHETTDEDGIDKIKYPTTLDCNMPEDGEEILVCNERSAWQDTCFNDDGYYLDSGNDWVDDVIAWQPLPQPYQP